jgi:apolipoprotein N-acyltransferase
MRFAGLFLATAISAMLYGLAFPPAHVRLLAWLALVPFLVALRLASRRGALTLAACWAILASCFVARALPAAASSYFLQGPIAGWAFSLCLWFVTGSIYYMGFALAYRGLARRPSAVLPLLVGAAWAGAEFGRSRIFTWSGGLTGNPWALLADSQAGWAAVVQIACVTGVYGISFVIASGNAALAEFALAVAPGRSLPRDGVRGLALAAILILATLAFGSVVLPSDDLAGDDAVRVAAVQGDLDLGSTWRPQFYGRNLDVYLELTRDVIRDGRPAIVFWPEAALTFFLEDDPTYRDAITRLAAAGNTELVIGGPSAEGVPPAEPVYHNSIFLVDAQGHIAARYDKQYLLPFSEYFPLHGLDFVRRRFERVRVFAHGSRTEPLATRAGRAGVLICNEALLPEVAGRRVAQGATFLVNPSNDSWLSDLAWTEAMLGAVSMRAVEQRRWLIRASTAGPSAIVDPWGRVRAQTPAGSRARLVGSLRPRAAPSIYGRVGDLFAGLCLTAVAVALSRRVRPSGVASASRPEA